MEKLKVKEVSEPVLLSDMFPHSAPPHVVFDGTFHEELDGKDFTIRPAGVRERDIHITDTTFRDGQQARPPYTVNQVLSLFEQRHSHPTE